MRRALVAIALVVVAVALLGACGGDDDSGGTAAPSVGNSGNPTVVLKGIAFHPSRVTIKAGSSVTWRWDDGGTIHDVHFDAFQSKLQSKGTYSHTFDTAGTYKYHCTVHPQMKGTVVVTS